MKVSSTARSMLLPVLLLFGAFSYAQEQVIQIGNVVNITILGSPELSRSVPVNENGTTDYPLLANVPVDGMTVSELKLLLTPILVRYVDRPVVFISLSDAIYVRVMGQVNRPGLIQAVQQSGIQGVIALAGGPTPNADLRKVTILHRNNGAMEESIYDLFDPSMEHTITTRVHSGDIVLVPMLREESYVDIIGAVNRPGRFNPTTNMNLIEFIYLAGGPTNVANLNKVTLITTSGGKISSTRYRIKSLIKDYGTAQLPTVKPGDVIVVEAFESWETLSFWAQTIRDVALLLSSYIILRQL